MRNSRFTSSREKEKMRNSRFQSNREKEKLGSEDLKTALEN
jgi:hypothetical protein